MSMLRRRPGRSPNSEARGLARALARRSPLPGEESGSATLASVFRRLFTNQPSAANDLQVSRPSGGIARDGIHNAFVHIPADTGVIDGLYPVINLADQSRGAGFLAANGTTAVGVTAVADPDGGTDAERLGFTAPDQGYLITDADLAALVGEDVKWRVFLASLMVKGTGSLSLKGGGRMNPDAVPVGLSSAWQRVTPGPVVGGETTLTLLEIDDPSGPVDCFALLIEERTGRPDVPGAYFPAIFGPELMPGFFVPSATTGWSVAANKTLEASGNTLLLTNVDGGSDCEASWSRNDLTVGDRYRVSLARAGGDGTLNVAAGYPGALDAYGQAALTGGGQQECEFFFDAASADFVLTVSMGNTSVGAAITFDGMSLRAYDLGEYLPSPMVHTDEAHAGAGGVAFLTSNGHGQSAWPGSLQVFPSQAVNLWDGGSESGCHRVKLGYLFGLEAFEVYGKGADWNRVISSNHAITGQAHIALLIMAGVGSRVQLRIRDLTAGTTTTRSAEIGQVLDGSGELACTITEHRRELIAGSVYLYVYTMTPTVDGNLFQVGIGPDSATPGDSFIYADMRWWQGDPDAPPFEGTRAPDTVSYPVTLPETKGTLILRLKEPIDTPNTASASLRLASGADTPADDLLFFDAGSDVLKSSDGTTTISASLSGAGSIRQFGLTWDAVAGERAILHDSGGTWVVAASGTFDGTWPLQSTLHLLQSSGDGAAVIGIELIDVLDDAASADYLNSNFALG